MAVDAARTDAGPLTAETRPVAADQASDLYARFRDRIYGFCLYRLDDADDADDAVQTTFLYAFRALRRGVVPVAEGPWLFAIARNVCLERHRSRRRRREIPADPLALASEAAAVERSADDGLRLEQALERLPDSQRLAYVLREWRGASYREIAATMGTTVAAVETLIFRARRTLAEALAEGEEGRDRRRLSRALDFGSLAAALKSALGGGAAAKLVAAAAVVSSVAVAAASAPPSTEPTAAPTAAHAARAPVLAEQPDLHGSVTTTAAPGAMGSLAPGVHPPEPAPAAPKPAPSVVDEPAGTVDRLTPEVLAAEPPLSTIEVPEVPQTPQVPELPQGPEVPELGVTLPLKGELAP